MFKVTFILAAITATSVYGGNIQGGLYRLVPATDVGQQHVQHQSFSGLGGFSGHGQTSYSGHGLTHGVSKGTYSTATRYQDQYASEPRPYSFGYAAQADGGSSSRSEESDGRKVTGSYTLQDVDGRSRTVKYVADEGGFRAMVETNEPGTESKSPADVLLNSNAPAVEYPVHQQQTHVKSGHSGFAAGGLAHKTYGSGDAHTSYGSYSGRQASFAGSGYGTTGIQQQQRTSFKKFYLVPVEGQTAGQPWA